METAALEDVVAISSVQVLLLVSVEAKALDVETVGTEMVAVDTVDADTVDWETEVVEAVAVETIDWEVVD